eukprot:5940096-Amphidinium_carterae.1
MKIPSPATQILRVKRHQLPKKDSELCTAKLGKCHALWWKVTVPNDLAIPQSDHCSSDDAIPTTCMMSLCWILPCSDSILPFELAPPRIDRFTAHDLFTEESATATVALSATCTRGSDRSRWVSCDTAANC